MQCVDKRGKSESRKEAVPGVPGQGSREEVTKGQRTAGQVVAGTHRTGGWWGTWHVRVEGRMAIAVVGMSLGGPAVAAAYARSRFISP